MSKSFILTKSPLTQLRLCTLTPNFFLFLSSKFFEFLFSKIFLILRDSITRKHTHGNYILQTKFRPQLFATMYPPHTPDRRRTNFTLIGIVDVVKTFKQYSHILKGIVVENIPDTQCNIFCAHPLTIDQLRYIALYFPTLSN